MVSFRILFVLFLGASLVIISALAFLSILSPEIFVVIVLPELIGIAKRIALLPRDTARVINGLSRIPIDIMRAIAVFYAQAEGGVLFDIGITSDRKTSAGSDC
jgi:hypothetical protein